MSEGNNKDLAKEKANFEQVLRRVQFFETQDIIWIFAMLVPK